MPKWIKGYKPDPDSTITTVEVIRPIEGISAHPLKFELGSVIEIARIIRTPAGLYFRIKNTKKWLQEKDVKFDIKPNQIVDYTGTYPEELTPEKSEKNKTKKSALQKKQKKEKISTNSRIRFVISTNKTIAKERFTGVIGMDKQVLRNALIGLQPEDIIKITFLGSRASDSGEFIVLNTRKGRGKGGSQLVDLRTADGETMTVGTPESHLILHVVTPDGRLHGHETTEDVPPEFETNASQAANLKETMKALVDKCTPLSKEYERDTRSRFVPNDDVSVTIESTHEPFSGKFTLSQVELKRGRYGKVLMTVIDTNGNTVLFDSFQHSGVITSMSVE